MTERVLPCSLSAIDAAIEDLELGATEALALQSGARAVLEEGSVTAARLREQDDAVALVLSLDGDWSDPMGARIDGLPALDVRVQPVDGHLEVTLEVPRDEDASAASTWERLTSVLRDEGARDAELERTRDELDETNRGVVALYAELDNHSRELQLADRRKNEFLAMLAHELRNPLAALHLAAEDLASESAEPTSRAGMVMQRQLVHLSRMVDDLLDVSRITRGKVDVTRERMDLSRAVQDAVLPRVPIAAEAGLPLELRLPDDEVWIEGDPTRIEQVVVNLVDNAIKYSNGDGRVDVTVESDETHGVVTVRDRGRGMTEEELRDAFELFVQHGSHELARSRGGLGIGLTLVREIVAMHGGDVTASSEGLGHGTTFRVALPRSGTPARAAAPGAAERPPEQHVHLLLVEDNEDFRELLAARLRRRGCEVDEAADGVEALARLRHGPAPDLVLTDVGLPNMDGYSLVRAIRADPELSGLRVVALTGYGGQAAGERTEEAGFDAHLVKPVPMDELMRVIHRG